MAASVSNLTQIEPADQNTWTAAAVGGADAAVPEVTENLGKGIDGVTNAQAFSNGSTGLTAGYHYSAWSGNFPASATYDVSGVDQAVVIHFANASPSYTNIEENSDSIWVILFSGGGTTNWGRWHFAGNSTIKNGKWYPLICTGTPDATGGTFDQTDVTGIGCAIAVSDGAVFGLQGMFDQVVYINGPVVLEDSGGAATVGIVDYYNLLEPESGQSYHSMLVAKAGPTVEFGFPISIQADDYDDSTTGVGIAFKPNDGQGFGAQASGYFQLEIISQSAGTIVFDNGALVNTATDYDLTVNGANGTLTMTNCLMAGVNDAVISGANLTMTNCTLVSPATCSIANADLELTITDCTADIQWTADLVAGSTITTNSDIDITFAETDLSDINIVYTASARMTVSPTTGSGTYDLSLLTTTGTVTLDNATANNTTITLASGTSNTVASPTEGGGTITVDSPAVTFTINSSESSSLIQIFTTNTQTVLSSTTGSSLAYVHSSETVDYVVQKAGFIPQRFTSKALSGTESVTVNLVADPIYNASHGLTWTTDFSYNASTRVMTIVANQEGRDLYSALIDAFIAQTALRNCPFPLVAIGPDRIDFKAVGYYNTATTVGATIDSGDITFWKGAGMEWEHDTTGNATKKFYSIKSANTLQASTVVGYTQVNTGTPVAATLVSNKVNQVIQFFEDTNGDGTPDYNYTGHLLFKGFLTGYYQARWDVINDSGVSTLEPYEYTINLIQTAIAGTTGDQTITITTLTDHTSAPLSVGGKSFDYELVDPGTNTAENLLAQHNYNVYNAVNADITGALYTSYVAFELPDLIVEAGANYETERGYFEGDGAVTDLSGVYLSRSAADHPNISRFQSNDGTYYTPATVAQISVPNVTAGRIQIYNTTAAALSAWAATTAYSQGDRVLRTTGAGSELGDGVFFVCTVAGTSGGSEPTWDVAADGNTTADGTVTWEVRPLEFDNTTTTSGYSNSWTDGEHFTSGDTIRMRWVDEDDLEITSNGVATAAGTTTFLDTPSDDTVYDSYAIDGSTVTEYSSDYPNVQVDLADPDNVFYLDRFYAWWKYNLTTEGGIRNFFGGVTATDTSNLLINNGTLDIYFDNTQAASARQGDTIVLKRADGAYPQVTTTSGGGGLGFYYAGIGYSTSSGSGLDTTERNKLLNLYDFNPASNTVEGSLTYQQVQRLILAAVAGKVSVSGDGLTNTFRDTSDSTDRIIATVDANGQRTAVTLDAT